MLQHYDRFLEAFRIVMMHEGGYVNDPNDPGGETKYGISKRSYPHLDIKNLTHEDAEKIYYKDWWEKYKYFLIDNNQIATKTMDLAVNMGPSRAHTLLQKACHAAGHRYVTLDGILGPQTFGAVNSANPDMIIAAYRAEAANYYQRLIEREPKFKKFEKGWMNRAYF